VNLLLNTEFENELYQACQILFGSEVDVSREFLFYIQSSGIKSAYRKQALLTHPDRSLHLSERTSSSSSDLFIKTNEAYEKLREFIRKRDGGRVVFIPSPPVSKETKPRSSVRKPSTTEREHRPSGTYYRGAVPNRKLFFGQFLFYSGAIPWEALIKAIVWQRNQRPKLGDLAKTWGWLDDEDLDTVTAKRNVFEPIGMAAVRLNLLNEGQVKMLLSRQQKLQKPFGEFFLLNKYLTRVKLINLLHQFHKHNLGTQRTEYRYQRTP